MTTHNLYIYSKNRLSTEKAYDFNLYLKNQIIIRPNQYINVDVMSFHMLNTMYNVSPTLDNQTFSFERRDLSNNWLATINMTIPSGNYSVLTLRDRLNIMFNNVISVSYNYPTNTYTFKNLETGYRYFLTNVKCSKLIGVSSGTELLSGNGTTGSYINMVDYQQVIVKTDLVYDDLNQDNIVDVKDDAFNISQILFWCNKQDVEPFKCISYTNQDGGDSFSYNIVNQNISKINFKIVNENNNLITDCGDWFLHIKFSVYDKNDMTYQEMANNIIKLLNNIYYVLLNILFSKPKRMIFSNKKM